MMRRTSSPLRSLVIALAFLAAFGAQGPGEALATTSMFYETDAAPVSARTVVPVTTRCAPYAPLLATGDVVRSPVVMDIILPWWHSVTAAEGTHHTGCFDVTVADVSPGESSLTLCGQPERQAVFVLLFCESPANRLHPVDHAYWNARWWNLLARDRTFINGLPAHPDT